MIHKCLDVYYRQSSSHHDVVLIYYCFIDFDRLYDTVWVLLMKCLSYCVFYRNVLSTRYMYVTVRHDYVCEHTHAIALLYSWVV